MKSPLVGETASRAAIGDSKWKMKALSRLIATGIAFIAMILFSASIHKTNENFITTTSGGYWTDGLALAPVCVNYRFAHYLC